jgi:putative membrane protein
MRIGPDDEKRITDAIRAAEKKTAGEIFCVMTQASSDYRLVPVAWAAIVALFVPLPLLYFTSLSATMIYVFQLIAFLVVVFVFLQPTVRFFIVPRRVLHDRASVEAQRQFAAHGLHRTEARTGVLIFVSVAERHVEVVADVGIAAKVSQEVWDRAVKALVQAIKNEKPADGFVEAIRICGEVLAEHFPPGASTRNELPDKLVVM